MTSLKYFDDEIIRSATAPQTSRGNPRYADILETVRVLRLTRWYSRAPRVYPIRFFTFASASSSLPTSLPPPRALSGLPPPLPPTMGAMA